LDLPFCTKKEPFWIQPKTHWIWGFPKYTILPLMSGKNNNIRDRISVLGSHFSGSSAMASEKEAALAATPSDADAPTMYVLKLRPLLLHSFSPYLVFGLNSISIFPLSWVSLCFT